MQTRGFQVIIALLRAFFVSSRTPLGRLHPILTNNHDHNNNNNNINNNSINNNGNHKNNDYNNNKLNEGALVQAFGGKLLQWGWSAWPTHFEMGRFPDLRHS